MKVALMKKLIMLLLILCFLGIAALGAAVINMGSGHLTDCFAMDGKGSCTENVWKSLDHHASNLNIFEAIPILFSGVLTLFALLFFSASIYLLNKNLFLSKIEFLKNRLRSMSWDFFAYQESAISWLSLLETSPARIRA